MKWGRAWLIVLIAVIAVFVLMFYTGGFMHGDPVIIPNKQ